MKGRVLWSQTCYIIFVTIVIIIYIFQLGFTSIQSNGVSILVFSLRKQDTYMHTYTPQAKGVITPQKQKGELTEGDKY